MPHILNIVFLFKFSDKTAEHDYTLTIYKNVWENDSNEKVKQKVTLRELET